MGLDMYLKKKTYVKNWSHMEPEQLHKVTVKKGGKVVKEIQPDRISSIEEQVAYWRKDNHIHAWFVNNVQDGEDDCGEYYVDREKLKELVDTCGKVRATLKNSPTKKVQVKVGWQGGKELYEDIDVYTDTELAEELLPTQAGFFFGGTEYDEWYLKGLEDTIKQITPLLEEKEGDFYYQSSW
jgi:hypothetical protein